VEICTVGSVRGESVGTAMVALNGHEAEWRIQRRKTYSTPGSPLLGEISGNANLSEGTDISRQSFLE
jgi:hypothetical protein